MRVLWVLGIVILTGCDHMIDFEERKQGSLEVTKTNFEETNPTPTPISDDGPTPTPSLSPSPSPSLSPSPGPTFTPTPTPSPSPSPTSNPAPTCGGFWLTPESGPSGTTVRLSLPVCRGNILNVRVDGSVVPALIRCGSNDLMSLDIADFEVTGMVGRHTVTLDTRDGCSSSRPFDIVTTASPAAAVPTEMPCWSPLPQQFLHLFADMNSPDPAAGNCGVVVVCMVGGAIGRQQNWQQGTQVPRQKFYSAAVTALQRAAANCKTRWPTTYATECKLGNNPYNEIINQWTGGKMLEAPNGLFYKQALTSNFGCTLGQEPD